MPCNFDIARAHNYTTLKLITQQQKLREGTPINKSNKLHDRTALLIPAVRPSPCAGNSACARFGMGKSQTLTSPTMCSLPSLFDSSSSSSSSSSSYSSSSASSSSSSSSEPVFNSAPTETVDHRVWASRVEDHFCDTWRENYHVQKRRIDESIQSRTPDMFRFTQLELEYVLESLASDRHLDAEGNIVNALRVLMVEKRTGCRYS